MLKNTNKFHNILCSEGESLQGSGPPLRAGNRRGADGAQSLPAADLQTKSRRTASPAGSNHFYNVSISWSFPQTAPGSINTLTWPVWSNLVDRMDENLYAEVDVMHIMKL